MLRWRPDRVHVEAVFITCGNVMGGYKLLDRRKEVELPSERTFRRRVTEALGTTGLASAKLGAEGVRAVDPAGRTVILDGRSWPTPDGGEPFLRAMQLERELDGAQLDESLLALLGEPVANASLSKAVTDAALEVGVRAVEGRVERHVTDRGWLRQRGITVEAV